MSWFRAACAVLCFLLGIGAAYADRRVALVIGNGAYQHAPALANPVIDSRRMRDKLRELGFEVVYGEDLDQRGMQRVIGRFASAVDGSDVALVYFAGHGATFADTPYVVPVDAEFLHLENMPYELVAVETLIGELRRSKGIRIAILDACRDNAAERDLKRVASRGLGGSRGLAPVKDPDGLIIAYGTQYMQTAADGDPTADSPFTAALLAHLSTPGLDVRDLFFEVGRDVIKASHGAQRPEISVSMFDPYVLNTGAPKVGPYRVAAWVVCQKGCPSELPKESWMEIVFVVGKDNTTIDNMYKDRPTGKVDTLPLKSCDAITDARNWHCRMADDIQHLVGDATMKDGKLDGWFSFSDGTTRYAFKGSADLIGDMESGRSPRSDLVDLHASP